MDSCVVKIPLGTKGGDVLTFQWPTVECSQNYQHKAKYTESSKRRRLSHEDSDLTYSSTKSDGSPKKISPEVLVHITIPSNIATKRSQQQYVKVYAPWVAAHKATNTTLDSRQLRTIGIIATNGSPRSRGVRKRGRGEGNVEKRTCPIGPLHQVSAQSIPKVGTWKENETLRSVELEKIWDSKLGLKACCEDKRIDQYMYSLQPSQKATFVKTLHQLNYQFDLAKREMNSKTLQVEVKINPSNISEVVWKNCDNTDAMLEGTPLTQSECKVFNSAIEDHQKQFGVIAKAVGTTVNRCLVHYYSRFKSGSKKGKYLELKKLWEQSDECEICADGGKKTSI